MAQQSDFEKLQFNFKTSRSSSAENTSEVVEHIRLIFVPTVLSLITFGLAVHLLPYLGVLGRLALVAVTMVMFEWFLLYGGQLSRKEKFHMDIGNILETTTRFEFNQGPDLNDITPGGCCGPYPKESILSRLTKSDSEEAMQRFYRSHYGPEYEAGKRRLEESRLNGTVFKDSKTSSKKDSEKDNLGNK